MIVPVKRHKVTQACQVKGPVIEIAWRHKLTQACQVKGPVIEIA